jgi:hypothetical protein
MLSLVACRCLSLSLRLSTYDMGSRDSAWQKFVKQRAYFSETFHELIHVYCCTVANLPVCSVQLEDWCYSTSGLWASQKRSFSTSPQRAVPRTVWCKSNFTARGHWLMADFVLHMCWISLFHANCQVWASWVDLGLPAADRLSWTILGVKIQRNVSGFDRFLAREAETCVKSVCMAYGL